MCDSDVGAEVGLTKKDVVLVVEDNADAVLLLVSALGEAGSSVATIQCVADGLEAIWYLSGLGAYADRAAHPMPRLVITDLKMPQVSGLELLAWLRQEGLQENIPTIVMSCSGAESDREQALALGAKEYIVKPNGYRTLCDIARGIRQRWLRGEA